jgi:hypothetical protein
MNRPTAASPPNRLATRLGLPAAGLTSLAPRGVWAWVERVRAGSITPAQATATLVLVYRTWIVALLLKALGSGWDVAWHFRFNRDDFAPPHNINLIGDGIAIALVLFHWYTRLGVDRLALRLMIGGATLFVLSAPIDVINHRINGLDITSWSVTHFGLYTGTGIMIAGVIRGWHRHSVGRSDRTLLLGGLWFYFFENVWFPAQHQEYGVEEIASWDRGAPYAERELLEFAAEQIGRPVDRESVVMFALPVPPWVYPVWIVAAAVLVLVIARRTMGQRWTATALSGAYVAWRCVLFPLLVAGNFPTSAVPFLILAGGVAVDLVCRLDLPDLAEAAAGAVAATGATYLGVFIQSTMLAAPPVSYWSAFAAGGLLFLGWAGFLFVWRNSRVKSLLTTLPLQRAG